MDLIDVGILFKLMDFLYIVDFKNLCLTCKRISRLNNIYKLVETKGSKIIQRATERGFESVYTLASTNSNKIKLGYTDVCICDDVQENADYPVSFSIPGIPSIETKKWVFGSFIIHPNDEEYRRLKIDLYNSLEDIYLELIKHVMNEKDVNYSVSDFFDTFDAYMCDIKFSDKWRQSKIQLKQEKHISINDIRLNELFCYVNNVVNANNRIQIDGFMTDYFCYKIKFVEDYYECPIFKDIDFGTVYTLKSIYHNEVIFGLKFPTEYSCNFYIPGLPLPTGTEKVIFGSYCCYSGMLTPISSLFNSQEELYEHVIHILSTKIDNVDALLLEAIGDCIHFFKHIEVEEENINNDTKYTHSFEKWEEFVNLGHAGKIDMVHIKSTNLKQFAIYFDNIVTNGAHQYCDGSFYFCHKIKLP